MSEQNNNNDFDLQRYLKAHDGVKAYSDPLFAAQIWLTPDMTRDDLQARIDDIARTMNSPMHFTVLNCPDFAAGNLFGEDGHFHNNPGPLIPQEDWKGSIQYYFPKTDDGEDAIWEPDLAEELEAHGSMQPYICAVQKPGKVSELHVSGVFNSQSILDLCQKLSMLYLSKVFFVVDSSTGYGFPVNPNSVIRWQHETQDPWNVDEIHVHNRQYFLDQLERFVDLADPYIPLDEKKTAAMIDHYEQLLHRALTGADLNA